MAPGSRSWLIGGGTEVDPTVHRHAFFFHYRAGASPDCRVHYSSRVGVLQLSQGSKLGLARGYERAPSGGELVLWCVVVFDRAAVIAPRRPRRVSTIKTSTSERDSLPKERRARREEGDLRRARQEKAFIHFVLITIIYVGKLIPMSPLRSFWVHCPPDYCLLFPPGLPSWPRSNLFSFHLCIEKHERSRAEAGRPPGAGAEAFSRSSLHVAPSSKAAPVFSPVKERCV